MVPSPRSLEGNQVQFSDTIDELLRRSNIVDIAAKLGVKVSKKESGYTSAVCPFHNDTKPSLALYSERGNPHYYCFACGARGGLFDLIDHQRGGSRPENLRWLAEEVGVQLPLKLKTGEISVKQLGWLSFSEWLQSNHQKGILADFATSRLLSEDVLKEFGAYAVDLSKLNSRGLTPAERLGFEEAGVLTRRRNKLSMIATGLQIVFPIDGGRGGFIFRAAVDVTDSAKGSRYRFSKGTKKSDILFGLSPSRKRLNVGAGDGLFVVEGIMDVLRLAMLGRAAVAILGTSISKHQADLICELSSEREGSAYPIHLFLDADDAGRRAIPFAVRALLGRADAPPLDVIFPNRDGDPDDLLRSGSAEETTALLGQWAFSALAALAHHYSQIPIASALAELPHSRPLLRVEVLRYVSSLLSAHWRSIRDVADPDGVFIPHGHVGGRSWLYAALDRAEDIKPAPGSVEAEALNLLRPDILKPGVHLRRALRIAQSSNFRREYPFDWGGMTRLSLAAHASALLARARLGSSDYQALPYAARFVPKDDGRTRLKAGPWPEDSVLQQYMLSEVLRARPEAPGWYLDFPATRLVRNSKSGAPIMTGPTELLPVGPPGQSTPVVSFAYQIDQQIIEGEIPPRREGMFVPYRECWQAFINHIDSFIAQQSLSTDRYFAVRLDISGFFDNLPRYVVEEVLSGAIREATIRNYSGRDFSSEVASILPSPEDAIISDSRNIAHAESISKWLLDQSFGYSHFDPATGSVKNNENPTVGIPQGPDLSAYLANLSLFPLDRLVTKAIEEDRLNVTVEDGPGGGRAIYGRYVDDLIIVSTSQSLLVRLEALVADELQRRSLSINAKHDRTQALNRRQVREWLLGERGAAVLVSASGEETPTTSASGVSDLLNVNNLTTRGHVLQLLHNDELYSPRWSVDPIGRRSVEQTLQYLRLSPSLKLRYYDWVSGARWLLHSILSVDKDKDAEYLAATIVRQWADVYGTERAAEAFGEDPREVTKRQEMLEVAPLMAIFDAIERSIDSRYDRKSNIDAETRKLLRSNRQHLSKIVIGEKFCDKILEAALADPRVRSSYDRVASMLRIQSMTITSLAMVADDGAPHGGTYNAPVSPTSGYAERRFALNAFGNRISAHAQSIMQDVQERGDRLLPAEAESLLGFHEAIGRLISTTGDPNFDPLNPIVDVVKRSVAQLTLAINAGPRGVKGLETPLFVVGLLNLFLENRQEFPLSVEIGEALHAFVEIIGGQPEGHALLSRRSHLVDGLTGDNSKALPVPPGVNARAFFTVIDGGISAYAFKKMSPDTLGSTSDIEDDPIFGISHKTSETSEHLVKFTCEIPENYRLSISRAQRMSADEVKLSDVIEYASAYRSLVNTYGSDLAARDQSAFESDQSVTPFHLLQPHAADGDWIPFGAYGALPAGGQAFVRLGEGRLHSIGVYANGAHLWQVGFALADHLGYRGFARSSELDRLLVDSIDINEDLSAVPFYVMQVTVPRLCGAFMARSRIPISAGPELPLAVERQLSRLEAFAAVDAEDALGQLVFLLEAGAEARAADVLRDAPAPLQIPGSLSATIRAVGRAATRHEKIFTENLPKPAPALVFNRRTADLWLQASTRLDGLPDTQSSLGLRTASAAMRVVAIGRATQSVVLELWALLNSEERSRLVHFAPNLAELEVLDEVLLVSRSDLQKNPSGPDQSARLVQALFEYTAEGATGRAALDRVTPLGWAVLLATMTGLVELEPLPSALADDVARPDLFAARSDAYPRKGALSRDEIKLSKLVSGLVAYLATPGAENAGDPLSDASWPWSAFTPLVEGVGAAVTGLHEAVRIIERLYGLVARTRESRIFYVAEADERGHCLVQRDQGGRVGLPGWQIDRDSLTLTKVGDLEERIDADGGRLSIWSEVVQGDRLLSISLAYKSLSGFAGASNSSGEPLASNPGTNAADPELATNNSGEQEGVRVESPRDKPELSAPSLASISSTAGAEDQEAAPISGDRSSAIDEVKQLWHEKRTSALGKINGSQSTSIRIALLQLNTAHVGHSFYHPVCEAADADGSSPEKILKRFRDGIAPSHNGDSMLESWRRAVLREALERCKKLNVELLVLPEYSVRAETVEWIAAELEQRAPDTCVLAGSFRQPAHAGSLSFHSPERGLVSLGAVVPLIVPNGPLPDRRGRIKSTTAKILWRLKKYPSTGLSELIRPEEHRLKAVYEMGDGEAEVPDRIRFVRDLICSEVFVTMSPANIFSTLPVLSELRRRFGSRWDDESHEIDVIKDIREMGLDTSPAIFRGLSKPRKTIIAVPAATTRPFDHHVFGEAGAKAAGLVTVFTNMSMRGGGESCFIGHYKSDPVEGSHVWSMQSPYHGRAPGIWTYEFSGGRKLGNVETALVVADVNPIDTNSSKPSRQIDSLPIALVAHIPFFIDDSNEFDAQGRTKMRAAVEDYSAKLLSYVGKIMKSEVSGIAKSTCEISSEDTKQIGLLALELSKIDERASASLEFRAGALPSASFQPHVFPATPALVDWAYIPRPESRTGISVPPIDNLEAE